MRIVIETKKTAEMRYDTVGDWFYEERYVYELGQNVRTLVIQVDEDTAGMEEQFLIALHELIEVKLCELAGISQAQVDHFDMEVFPDVCQDPEAEPGDHPSAPYRTQHRFAMLIEHLMAREMGLVGYGVVR